MNVLNEKDTQNLKHEPDSHAAKDSAQEASDNVTLPRKELDSLNARLKELEDLKDKLLRSAADFENAKKRLAREREDFVRFAQENLIRSLLPVLDNFERALAHAAQPSGDITPREIEHVKAMVSGIEMVYRQLSEILKGQGLVRIKTEQEIFDPQKHEAVAYHQEEGKDHEILEEIEAGYLLGGRLLRAAKVKIRVVPPADAGQGGASAS